MPEALKSQAGMQCLPEHQLSVLCFPQLSLVRPVRDLQHRVPDVEVAVDLPSMKATLSDREYQLITSVAGANLSEATRVPEAARWLQKQHLPGTLPDDAEGDDSDGDLGAAKGSSPRVRPSPSQWFQLYAWVLSCRDSGFDATTSPDSTCRHE